MVKKNTFLILSNVDSDDLNQIFPVKPSEFEIFLLVESFNKKTAEICTLPKNA